MLEVLKFIKENENWEEILSEPPYSLKISHDGDYVLLKYNQIESDFNNPIVRECRGIIIYLPEMKVVRLAFPKFFNVGEVYADDIDWESAYASEKLDGSLISMWFHNGWHVSTNSTIDARKAPFVDCGRETNFFDLFMEAISKETSLFLKPQYIYTFELVGINSPVVHYPESKLYHILTRDAETLEEVDINCGVTKPAKYMFKKREAIQAIVDSFDKSHEGVVICDKNFHRVKLKTPLYFKIHKLISNRQMTLENAVDIIRQNEQSELLCYFPRYRNYFEEVENKINEGYKYIDSIQAGVTIWKSNNPTAVRADFAKYVKSTATRPELWFLAYDNKLYKTIEKADNKRFISFLQLES